MAKLDAPEVATLLAEYGRRSALRGGNPYRSKAYIRAAENLAALAEPLERIVEEGCLKEIPGVGDAIADIITKLHRSASIRRLKSFAMRSPRVCWKAVHSRTASGQGAQNPQAARDQFGGRT